MRSGIIGGLVGAGIVGGLAFLLREPAGEEQQITNARIEKLESAATALMLAKPRSATITLRRGSTARCVADIDVTSMGGYVNERVRWNVVDDPDDACRPDGAWAVWLVFEGSDYPFPQREVRIGRVGRTVPIKSDARESVHTYKVWMRGHNAADYELIDPDLEVEPPPYVPVK